MNDEGEIQKKPVRLPGMPEHVQEFLLCILFHLLFPFLPLLVEVIVIGRVEERTWLLFMAVYPLSIGVSSRSRLFFGFTVVVCLVSSTLFGLVSREFELSRAEWQLVYGCVSLIMVIHAGERYNRHVADEESFWEFAKEQESCKQI